MCRWLAYSGESIHLEELLLKPERSLIEQSLQARGGTTTNGDGFGVGWYGDAETPGLYKSVRPAWNDSNLLNMAAHLSSPLFVAHVRATTGTPIQRSNCHPFQHGSWLFMHNGEIRGFHDIKREIVLEVEPALFPEIEGTTDTEIMFYLAWTFGLEEDPVGAMERTVGLVEAIGERHRIEHPMQMTVGITDGRRIYAFRYSSEGKSYTLYHSMSMEALHELDPSTQRFSDDARVIVSEPLTDLSDYWVQIPESTAVLVENGDVEMMPFVPAPPA